MDISPLLILGVCGMTIVCGGLLVVLFALFLRLSGSGIMNVLSVFGGGQDKNDEDRGPSYIPRPRPDLRSIAEAQDFDSALNNQKLRDTSLPRPTTLTDQSAPPPAAPDLRRSRRGDVFIPPSSEARRRGDDDEEDAYMNDILG